MSYITDNVDFGFAEGKPPTRAEVLLNETVSCAAGQLFKVRLYPDIACWLISGVCDSMSRLVRDPRGVVRLGHGPSDRMLTAINDARSFLLLRRPPLSTLVLENGLHSLALLTLNLTNGDLGCARQRPEVLADALVYVRILQNDAHSACLYQQMVDRFANGC